MGHVTQMFERCVLAQVNKSMEERAQVEGLVPLAMRCIVGAYDRTN